LSPNFYCSNFDHAFFLQKFFSYIKFSYIWFLILHAWLMLYTLKYLRFFKRKKRLVKSATVKCLRQVNENGGKYHDCTWLPFHLCFHITDGCNLIKYQINYMSI
jgi:hypothetical protein